MIKEGNEKTEKKNVNIQNSHNIIKRRMNMQIKWDPLRWQNHVILFQTENARKEKDKHEYDIRNH